jgi:long-chain acyl-CoA synthetase
MPLLTDRLNFGNIYFRDKTYTPDTVRQSIDAVAGCLNKQAVSNSPFVYLFAPNHIKMVYAFYGIIKSGRICVLVDPAIGKLELAEMMADTVPGALIRIDKTTDTFDFAKEFEFRDCRVKEKRLAGLEDVCLIVYTNACDGWAKGAMLTNENLLANAEAIVEVNNVQKGTVSCAVIALHHMFALQTGLIAPFLVSGNVLIADIVDFGALRRVGVSLRSRRITHLYAVPVVYHFLRRLPATMETFKWVQSCVSGGCKLPKSAFELFEKSTGIAIREGYGLTEASPICTWHRPGDTIKLDSVGRAFPCCEVEVLGDRDRKLPVGEFGEICIKGKNVFKGYYNNESATQAVLRNGRLHTGDFGKMDSDGYVYLVKPRPLMINVSGNKVYRAELERLMKMNENVLNVRVSKEPDELIGARVGANVELKGKGSEAQDEFRKWCVENIGVKNLPMKMTFVQPHQTLAPVSNCL